MDVNALLGIQIGFMIVSLIITILPIKEVGWRSLGIYWLCLAVIFAFSLIRTFQAWSQIEKDGGFRETWSKTYEVEDRMTEDGNTIQVINYERNGELLIGNITSVFKKVLPKGTKIRVYTFEKERWWYNLKFTNYNSIEWFTINVSKEKEMRSK